MIAVFYFYCVCSSAIILCCFLSTYINLYFVLFVRFYLRETWHCSGSSDSMWALYALQACSGSTVFNKIRHSDQLALPEYMGHTCRSSVPLGSESVSNSWHLIFILLNNAGLMGCSAAALFLLLVAGKKINSIYILKFCFLSPSFLVQAMELSENLGLTKNWPVVHMSF